MFSQVCVCSTFRSGQGGYPISGLDGGYQIPGLVGEGGTPFCWPMGYPGYPPSKIGWGTPPPFRPGMRGYPRYLPPQLAKRSTYYAAGGVPLAFTQEDFLAKSFSVLISGDGLCCSLIPTGGNCLLLKRFKIPRCQFCTEMPKKPKKKPE